MTKTNSVRLLGSTIGVDLGDRCSRVCVLDREGEVVEDGELRVLVVEEVERPERFVFRWATFDEPPSRVEIEIIEFDGGSRVIITETPLEPIQMRADASATLVGTCR